MRRQKETSVSLDSGAVRKVAASQAAVVIPTVMIMIQANSTGLSESSFQMAWSATLTTNDEALTRHQYHRSSSTPPVPAPVTMSNFQAPAIESM